MVAHDLRDRDIADEAVLQAMGKVPRHLFVDPGQSHQAYADSALPLRQGQTISQPYIVALMTQSARLQPSDTVLEIGTGSGYQGAVLAEIVRQVYSIEIIESLADEARARLRRLGYNNIEVKHGDGFLGWREHAPFDAILVTAAAPKIPQPLVDQLREGGRMVIPLGTGRFSQDLMVLTKTGDGLIKKFVTGVIFVPMTGAVRK